MFAKGRVCLAVLFLFVSSTIPTTFQDVYASERFLKEEIARHVLDECDLFSLYKKNRIEFDPLEVAPIVTQIHKTKARNRQTVTRQILQVVKSQRSFYKRGLIYNIYYKTCLNKTTVPAAEKDITRIISRQVTDKNILKADTIISNLYTTRSAKGRETRDRAKIRVLSAIQREEPDPNVKRKTQSIIRELKYDIELWVWDQQ